MVELNRVDQVGPHTYEIYGKHHLPHKGEHKLVATVKMNNRENSLTDCKNLPVLFMNAQVYRDDNMRLQHEFEKLNLKAETQAAELATLRSQLAQAREAALEEAARVADEGHRIWGEPRCDAAEEIAAAIRALKGPAK